MFFPYLVFSCSGEKHFLKVFFFSPHCILKYLHIFNKALSFINNCDSMEERFVFLNRKLD